MPKSVATLLRALSFFGIWILLGFAAGTALLLGPVRAFVSYCRDHGWPDTVERAGVIFAITLLIILSAVIAMSAVWWATGSRSILLKFLIAAIPAVLAGIAGWWWMEPERHRTAIAQEIRTERFTYGPYPDELKMRRLHQEGYAIVSLLHPAVVPFEPALIEREQEAARRTGARLISVPMLPWVSGNSEALATLRRLAREPGAKYYVHCYLGRDRIRMAQRVLEERDEAVVPTKRQARSSGRGLKDMRKLERGKVYRLGEDIFLTGFPTDEEWGWFVLDGSVRAVVALLDPVNPEDVPWIRRETEMMADYGMPFRLIPVRLRPYDPAAVASVLEQVRDLPRPILIHTFLSPSSGRSPVGEGLLQSYYTRRLSIPPALFDLPLTRGPVEVIAPHVAFGPQPHVDELFELRECGVQRFFYVGDRSPQSVAEHAKVVAALQMPWTAITEPRDLLPAVANGGPYYVYGDVPWWIRLRLRLRYGPAVPHL